jgi:hypothetical protein
MKNVFKVLGIIALMAIVGFSMVSCGDDGGGDKGFNVKVVNNYGNPITKVGIQPPGMGTVEFSETLAAGGTKTFPLDLGKNPGGNTYLALYATGLNFSDAKQGMEIPAQDGQARTTFWLEKDKTVTITLTADGKITK